MNIPLVDLKAQYQPLKEEILAGFARSLEGMWLFLGENVQSIEREFAQFCNAKHGIGVSDGTAALHIILRAMDIGPGDEVITVSHTFIATAEAIILAGATPVFVDIDPETCLMDVGQVEAHITPRTRAILPVHLYGQTVDMEPLMAIARQHDLKVIEDACQAHGAEYKGRRAGSLGDAAAFSFYFSKNLGAYGEGGFITTNDDEIARRARMIRDHGSERKYYHDLMGLNGRLDELQAVVLRAKLPHLETWTEKRRQHAAHLSKLLQESPVSTPVEIPGNRHVYHLYVIQSQQRDDLLDWLHEKGVGAGVHYPVPIHLQNSMGDLGYSPGSLPVTEQVVGEIISLPMYAELNEQQVVYMAETINEFVTQKIQFTDAP
jgi:dTDP-4-amino-4,6-dideoxygalactose transaminase